MPKLFIYYSFTGNGDIVASKMQELGYDLLKVEPTKKLPKSFFWSVMMGGFEAGLNKKAKLKDFDVDLAKYEEVAIGSPIWNGRFSTPINTVLATFDLKDKKVRFVLYSGSGEGPKALKKINKLFPNAEVVFLQEPKKHSEELDKIK